MRLLACTLLLGLAMAACAPRQLGAAAVVVPFRRPYLPTSLPHQDFAVQTQDGLTLRGWLFRPEGPSRGLVVFLHGKDDNRANGLEAVRRFVPRGYTVLLYDQRAHGGSDGRFTTYGHHEVDDLRRALDAVGEQRVIAMGMSLGAAVALQAAAVEPRIVAVAALASFSDLPTIVREKAGPLANGEAELVESSLDEADRVAGFASREISPLRAAASLEIPVLLVHGLQDGFTNAEHAQRLYDALPGPKRLVLVDGASHADLPYHPAVWDVLEGWVAEQK